MASYWLLEEQLVHKLFKVLVPRYRNSQQSYTKMWKVSVSKPTTLQKTVLELRNNIYPPLGEVKTNNKNLLHNVLLREASKYYEMKKSLNNDISKKETISSTNSAIENTSNDIVSDSKSEESNSTDEDLSLNKLNLETTENQNTVNETNHKN